jgi:hypothetical protein
MKFKIGSLLILLFAAATLLKAEDVARPDENSLFGGSDSSASASTTESVSPTAAKPEAADRDAMELNSANTSKDEFASGETVDNPLQMGGIYYQQLIFSPTQGQSAAAASISAPLQLDTFLDARPNDRIRGYVDARLLYDPTRDANSLPTEGSAGFASFPSSLSSTSTTSESNPQVVLDQAWLKFDIDQDIFVTAGRQHLKWGSSHTWNPTDFLTSQKYNPLLPYDTRLGSTMLKFEMPLVAERTNLYAIALLDNPEPASTLGQVGGAFRAETVLWGAEMGLDAVTRAGMNPDYGADISAPLGPLDIYAEAALLSGNNSVEELSSVPQAGQNLNNLLGYSSFAGPALQSSAGLNYSFPWKDNRQATLGAEYFYNELGSSNYDIYPVLLYQGNYQPFYLGKNYATIYITAEGPDANKNTNYTFSTISNISDGSYVSRLDFSWLLLDYLTFGAYADGHYGTAGGEFNLSENTPAVNYQGKSIPAINFPSTPFDLGLSLRIGY